MHQDKKKLGIALRFQYGTSSISFFRPSPQVSGYFLYEIPSPPPPPLPPPRFSRKKNTVPHVAYSNRFRPLKRWKCHSITYGACAVLVCYDVWHHCVFKTSFFVRPQSLFFFSCLAGCGSVVNNVLKSPRYPLNYPDNMDCNYWVLIPLGYVLNISFSSFELEYSWSCR